MRHPVEERLQRLLAVMAGIAGKGPVALSELAERYQVSAHQLRKDLTLAQFIGVPPYDLPGQTPEVTFHGDAVEVWVPSHFAAQPTLTRPEAFAVLAAGRAAISLSPDLDALTSAMDKLAAALRLEGDIDVEIEQPTHLAAVRAAVDAHRRLDLGYWSAWRDELTTRLVDPLQVTFIEGAWYLLAVDDSSGELRRFRVDRIVECSDTGAQFVPRAFEPLTEVFEPPPFAVLASGWFPAGAHWVTEYVDLDVTAEDDEGFTATVTSVGDVWLARLLLRTGGHVIAPPEMVDLRRAAARSVLARYADGV